MDIAGEGIKENENLIQGGQDEKEKTKTPKKEEEEDPEHQPLLSEKTSGTDEVINQASSSQPSSSEKKKEMKIDIPPVVMPTRNNLQVPSLQKQQSTGGPLKMAVFIKRDKKLGDGGRYILELEKGRATPAGEIKEKMLDLLAIPKSSAHLFALWLISPYLELQIKYHHPPFYLRKQWCELLLKLSSCPPEEISLDEPVVVFQRNSFITIEEEKKDTENNVLKRLFEEASYNILKARYPIPVADAEILGGILLRCYEGEYSPELHKPGVFKKRLNEFLPYYAIGSNKISQYIYSSSTEQHLLQQYEIASKNLNDKFSCYKAFLDYCRKLVFYGCVFFKGSCFQEGVDYKIWKSERQEITLGLNRYGITFFKAETEEMLSHLPYNEFSWDYKKDDELDDRGSPIERFIIEYDEDDGSRQIQIISKQSCLMDAMVQSCANFIDEVAALHSHDATDRKKLHIISYKVNDPTTVPVTFTAAT